jgi:hypothetical protein
MNNTLTLLLENVKGLQLDCLTFDFRQRHRDQCGNRQC